MKTSEKKYKYIHGVMPHMKYTCKQGGPFRIAKVENVAAGTIAISFELSPKAVGKRVGEFTTGFTRRGLLLKLHPKAWTFENIKKCKSNVSREFRGAAAWECCSVRIVTFTLFMLISFIFFLK